MVANGILNNPAMFTGASITPTTCIQDWLDVCYNTSFTLSGYEKEYINPTFAITEASASLPYRIFHQLIFLMLEKVMTKKERSVLYSYKTFSDLQNFLDSTFNVKPRLYEPDKFLNFVPIDIDYSSRCDLYEKLKPRMLNETNDNFIYRYEDDEGKFFKQKIESLDSSCDISDVFLENS